MKSNDKARQGTNPEFDGIAATPRSRLLHYSKARLTLRYYSRVRHCLSSALDPELRHTLLHQLRPSAQLVSDHQISRQQVQPDIRTYQTIPTPTILHHVSATALLLLPQPLSLPIATPLALPLPLPHPHDIMLSQPHDSYPAISAAGLDLSLPQPLTKFDPGPSDQPPNIMRDTSTPLTFSRL